MPRCELPGGAREATMQEGVRMPDNPPLCQWCFEEAPSFGKDSEVLDFVQLMSLGKRYHRECWEALLEEAKNAL